MRRSAIIITAAIVLALVGAGAVAANVLTVRNEPGVAQPVDPVVAVPDPSLTPTPEPPTPDHSVAPPSSPAPVPPAPPEDLDDDDDDDLDDDDVDDN
jgi:hypothetical protein